jgi:hypothetical protein
MANNTDFLRYNYELGFPNATVIIDTAIDKDVAHQALRQCVGVAPSIRSMGMGWAWFCCSWAGA